MTTSLYQLLSDPNKQKYFKYGQLHQYHRIKQRIDSIDNQILENIKLRIAQG